MEPLSRRQIAAILECVTNELLERHYVADVHVLHAAVFDVFVYLSELRAAQNRTKTGTTTG